MSVAIVYVEPLTERELQVLGLAAGGLGNKEIGRALHIHRCTARGHLSNAFAKLGARNRAHAVRIAMQAGLIEVDEPLTCQAAVTLASHYCALAIKLLTEDA